MSTGLLHTFKWAHCYVHTLEVHTFIFLHKFKSDYVFKNATITRGFFFPTIIGAIFNIFLLECITLALHIKKKATILVFLCWCADFCLWIFIDFMPSVRLQRLKGLGDQLFSWTLDFVPLIWLIASRHVKLFSLDCSGFEHRHFASSRLIFPVPCFFFLGLKTPSIKSL